MPKKNSLEDYNEKRNFGRTPEPAGGKKGNSGKPIFVIQKHDASRLHYDFRIEVDGVLKSWAVPKGPSTDPKEKRLAVPTEDHPLEYAEFEGTIPAEEYGGGTVLVWDMGRYRNLTEKNGKLIPMAEAVEQGHIVIWLEGKKLKGGYALTRFRKGKDESWLLVKMKDAEANAAVDVTAARPQSVLSGRTIEEIGGKHSAAEPQPNFGF
jgi:DNA ligase D-like protein (predicted 3'-phosphoesterase)